DETGVYSMPGNEIARLKKSRGVSALPVDQVHPNALSRVNLRANLNAQIAPTATLQISSAFVNSIQRLPQNEDNSTGIMVNAQGGTAARLDNFQIQGLDTIPLYGQFAGPMGDIFSITTTQGINRFINSASLRWLPTNWLSTHATTGLDYTSRVDQVINLFDQGPFNSSNRVGAIDNERTAISLYTVDLGATGSFGLTSSIQSKTSVGAQYFDNFSTRTGGSGQNLPPGATTVTAVGTIQTLAQATAESITLGTYLDQQFNFRDRLFVTGGVRLDDNSAFGAKFKGVKYPHVGVSWVISDEGFFPRFDFLQQLRLRGTYGASGVQPGTLDALRYFLPSKSASQTGGADGSGVTLGALGNPNLKPEFTAESEGGLDLSMFHGGTNIELTYYQKNTRDALIRRDIAPSLAGLPTQFTNIGKVRNAGVEFVLNQKLFDRKLAALSFNLTGSTNANRLVQLGTGVAPIFTGNRNTQKNITGYPLFGLWARTYTINDRNGDGIVANKSANDPGDLTYSDTAVFIGNTYPKLELAFSPSLEVFNHKLRFNAQFDRKANLKKLYNTQRHECQGGQSCRFLYDKTASLADQARAVALTDQGLLTGFMYDGSFTRFRELSVAYQMPDQFAHYLRANRWNLVLTGRNLHVWTKYPGVDPESTVGNTDARGNEEYFATPPLRVFTFRMNFTF
ncbi:MAG: TonB-dependent receptor, partial [Gemmatimonadota bacterium]|nr:TonB-dependent receptor [Gemmatimonadota bacterium]